MSALFSCNEPLPFFSVFVLSYFDCALSKRIDGV